jgi:hypothetical protein
MAVQDGPGRPSRLGMMLGHYSRLVMMAAIVVTGVTVFTGGAALLSVALACWAAYAVTARYERVAHAGMLCGRCVAATPLDPQAAITRWRPALSWFHSRWYQVDYLIFLGWWVIADLLAGHLDWLSLAGDGAAYLVLTWGVLASHQHRRLHPWCPDCGWGDGGDTEGAGAPDPAPSVSR